MIIKNVTGEDLSKALSEVNKKYDDNIIWKNYTKLGEKRFRVTLRVADSTKKGHRLSYAYWINKHLGHSNKAIHKRLVSACWHVHGDFFDILLKIQPNAIIKTSIERRPTDIYKDEQGVIINNWQDWNIGSQMYPWYYSEACECNQQGAPEEIETNVTVKSIRQNNLTSECWGVQIWGLTKCDTCEFKDTDECGGQNIRKTGKNRKGLSVPIS